MTPFPVVLLTPAALDVSASGDPELDEAQTFHGSGTFSDTGATSWTATVDYGDGAGDQPLTLNGFSFDLSYTYVDNGTFTITITVEDNLEQVTTYQFDVIVHNVAPSLSDVSATPTDAGGSTTLTGTISDPGTLDSFELVVQWGDDATTTVYLPAGTTFFSVTYSYPTDGSLPTYYYPSVSLTDKDYGTGTAYPYVNNAYPVYRAAVRVADEAYLEAVEQLIQDAEDDIYDEVQAAQNDLNVAYQTYLDTANNAEATYNSVESTAWATWLSAFEAAANTYNIAAAAAMTTYQEALETASQSKLDAEQTALADYDAAVAVANTAYDDAVAAAQAALDTAQATYDTAVDDAAVTLQAALDTAAANYQSALDTIATAYNQAVADAQAVYDAAVAAAQADVDTAQANFQATVATETATLQSALAAADADYQAAEDAATATYDQAVADAQAAYDSAVAAAQADVDDAQAAYDADPQNSTLWQALQDAIAAYDATVASESVTLQGANDTAAADYQTALDAADATYDQAVADAQTAYDTAVNAAQAAVDAAQATYTATVDTETAILQAALATAQQVRSDAEQATLAVRDAAEADAQTAHNDAISAAEAAWDDAQADYVTALDTAATVLQDALDAADAAYQAALDSAEAAYEQAIADAESNMSEALEDAYQIFEAAIAEADDDYTAVEEPAWVTFVTTEENAWQTYLNAEATIEAELADTVNGIIADVDDAYARAAWEVAEAAAWADYLDALAQDPANPPPQERITEPPAHNLALQVAWVLQGGERNQKKAGPVKFKPATIGNLYDQTMQLPEARRNQLFGIIKSSLNVDLTDATVLNANKNKSWLTNVTQDDNKVYGSFMANVRFNADLKGINAELVQVINVTKFTSLKNGGFEASNIFKAVEVFAVDNDGKAKVLDTHFFREDLVQLEKATVEKISIEVSMKIGVGLYDDEPITEVHKIFNNATQESVKHWLGPIHEYKIIFELSADGSWVFKDPVAGVDQSGKWNMLNPKQ